MNRCTILAFTPSGHLEPALAIAASRAGCIGILDAGRAPDWKLVVGSLECLARHARNPFGIALTDVAERNGCHVIAPFVPQGLGWLILDPDSARAWAAPLAPLRVAGLKLLIELIGADASVPSSCPHPDGWIVKGHEAGGWVGEETTLILIQWALAQGLVPVYARGGIGIHTAAACVVAGASGLVLDSQLLLLRESPLRMRLAGLLHGMVGTETALLGDPTLGRTMRALDRPACTAARGWRERVSSPQAGLLEAQLSAAVGWEDPSTQVLPVGQDAAWAEPWALRYGCVAAVLKAIAAAATDHLPGAARDRVLAPDGPLTQDLGTRLPIVQGPMTRVSDVASFARAVGDADALPMVALALLRGPTLEKLLEETSSALGERPWGVGILGFAPADLRKEQINACLKYKPRAAILAGGRPDQVVELERQGIPGFLHVPSPRLLSLFLEQGARRFIFEGRECGGHVGPLTSFVLWESMVETLLEHVSDPAQARELQLLFAGGIHDAASAAMVATLTAPLTALGMRVGLVVGTAYLFTHEIVSSGALVRQFQEVALACKRTITFESGPGHASRGADTPFARHFLERKRQLVASGEPAEAIRGILDDLNLGRLRMASKGLERMAADRRPRQVPLERQQQEGMYMIGQVASLRQATMTVAELHADLTLGATNLINQRAAEATAMLEEELAVQEGNPAGIAIVGIGVHLPGATSHRDFWQNIVEGKDAIGEIPPHRWDWRLYFDPDRQAPDRIYSRWGGFLEDLPFDPLRYGLPPKAIPHLDPLQLMTLEVVSRTLEDAGYASRPFDRERASVILGASGGAGDVGAQYAVRAETPRFTGGLDPDLAERLPKWSEDTFAGILLNVSAGRAANRFDFGGVNFTVDAACASSLTAIYQAVVELEDGRSDLVIAGGVDTVQGPFGYLCFSKTQALSPQGRCKTFDASADGIVISEGIAMLALKRLADAERDGDRIYAVIQGFGGSSDGRARSLTAPHPDGQLRALERAYRKAGYSPTSVDFFEAHGTGTVAGDTAELETVTRLLRRAGASPRQSAIGSVKTLIGHTKATAGVAGLIKAAMALYYRVLPPHRNVETPNPKLAAADSLLYLLRTAQPWLAPLELPRRAGVSAFGFGGTNFHITLEEYQGDYLADSRPAPLDRWRAELFLWRAPDRARLIAALEQTLVALNSAPGLALRDLAFSLMNLAAPVGEALAIVAKDVSGLGNRIEAVLAALRQKEIPQLPPGCHFGSSQLGKEGKLALLFPGQGSQYPDMLIELAILFPDMQEALDLAERELAALPPLQDHPWERLGRIIYPPGRFDTASEQLAASSLTRTQYAQPALGALEAGLWSVLRRFGLAPAMAAGHSYGEYVALHAAGVLNQHGLVRLSAVRGRCVADAAAGQNLGGMVAVEASRDQVETWLGERESLVLANHNGPLQSVVAGPEEALGDFVVALEAQGVRSRRLAVSAAFHSPLVAPAAAALNKAITAEFFAPPLFTVYSNRTGRPHASDPELIRAVLQEHLANPVEFVAGIEDMYAAGGRLFLEVGPGSALTGMTKRILNGRPHRAIQLDDRAGGLKGLLNALGALWAEGLAIDARPLFAGRDIRQVPMEDAVVGLRRPRLEPHMWWLNGSGARPLNAPRREVLTVESARAVSGHAAAAVETARLDKDSAGVRKVAAYSPPSAALKHAIDLSLQLPASSSNSVPAFFLNSQENFMSERPPPSGPAAPPETVEPVWTAYYQTMHQFLQVQEKVMLAYLASADRRTATQRRLDPTFHPAGTVPVSSLLGVRQELYPSSPPPQTLTTGGGHQAPAPATDLSVPVASVTPPASLTTRVQSEAQSEVAAVMAAPVAVGEAHVAAPLVMTGNDSSPLMTRSITLALGGTEATRELLLGIVEDRTGYPRDMLDPNQNLEADLGIDSIKRVEIISALLKALPAVAALPKASETLGNQQTLQGILDWLAAQGGDESAEAEKKEGQPPFELTGAASAGVGTSLPRFVPVAYPVPLPFQALPAVPKGVYVVCGKAGALVTAIVQALAVSGCHAEILSGDDATEHARRQAILARARGRGRVVGLLHLVAVDSQDCPDPDHWPTWRAQTARNEKSLFYLLRELAAELRDAGLILAATALGGTFGRVTASGTLTAQGGAVGLLKSLREEWPGVRVKAVDLDLSQTAEEQAQQLVTELRLPAGRIEVGYPQGVRTEFRTQPAPLEPPLPTRGMLDPDWVILATGGARGITAAILEGLAVQGLTLVLVGRSPEPMPEEPGLAAIATDKGLRAHFIAAVRAKGLTVRPVEIDRQVDRVLRARELQTNLARLRSLGARIDYQVADVRDPMAISALLKGIYARYGRLDGVIHAAGIIEDRLLVDKTTESWERVFDTKADTAWLLATALRPEQLRFLVFFSSVAGRYGNRGQTDYAAANELMNRLAWSLSQRWAAWPVRVAAINWGPWAGSGMVSAATQALFEARGVVPIQPLLGRSFFLDEILRAPAESVEIIAGEGPWESHEAEVATLDSLTEMTTLDAAMGKGVAAWPLLGENPLQEPGPKGDLRMYRTLSLANDPYLTEHLIDGTPVLPAAVALEFMAEAAAEYWPDWEVEAITDVRQLSGIRLTDDVLPLIIGAKSSTHGDAGGFEVGMTLSRRTGGPPCYRANVKLSALPQTTADFTPPSRPGPFTRSAGDLYRDWLFHGPRFQTVTRLLGLDEHGILAEILPTRPDEWRIGCWRNWLFDPGVVDSAPQMALIWTRAIWGKSALPSRIGAVRRFGKGPLEPLSMHFQVRTDSGGDHLKADIAFVSRADGRMRLQIEGLECIASPALNRLGGGWRGEIRVP